MPGLSLSPSLLHHALAGALEPSHRFAGGEVGAWQRSLRARLGELIGLPRMPAPGPLLVRQLWQRDLGFARVEKLAFEAEPGADALAYLATPTDRAPPH